MTVLRMHVAMNVTDLEKNLEFYKAFFGTEPTKVKSNYAKFELQDPPLHFSMNVRPYESKGVLNHLGVQVDSLDTVMAARERLQKAGLITLDEMNTTCCYAVQDKIWVQDPEGNAWEVFYTKADSEFESARIAPQTSACGCSISPSETITASAVQSTCCTSTSTAKSDEPKGCCTK